MALSTQSECTARLTLLPTGDPDITNVTDLTIIRACAIERISVES